MSQRYVLNSLNMSNLNNMTRADESMISRNGSRKDLSSSMHSLSKTKTPTRLSSKGARDPSKAVPIEKYEELVHQCNELNKTTGLLKRERDQFCKAYQDLKFISEREKVQLCQSFEELKINYVQLQNRLQAVSQEGTLKKFPSTIDKVNYH